MLKKLFLALPLGLGLSLNVAAEIDSYAGLSLGLPSTDEFDNSGTYFKIFGGNQVTSFMNLEFGFHHFGELEQDEPTRLASVDAKAGGFSGGEFGSTTSVVKDLYAVSVPAGGPSTPGTDDTNETYNQFTGNLKGTPMGVSFALVPFYEVVPGLNVFAKVGALAWWAELEVLTLDGVNAEDLPGERSTKTRNINSLDAIIGAGITYQIIPELSVRAEFEQFELSETTFRETKLDIYSLSASYHF